ncbi:MAG: hypothetical protein VW455_11045 [Nitrospinota bacterium]
MKRIERTSILTSFILFTLLYLTTLANAEGVKSVAQVAMQNEKCSKINNNMKGTLGKIKTMHTGMEKTLKSNQPIDKYNRHVNILVGNLEHYAQRMERLLGKAEKKGCNKMVQMMRGHVANTKSIFESMMATIQLPAPKEPLEKQNNQLKSELDSLMEAQQELSNRNS